MDRRAFLTRSTRAALGLWLPGRTAQEWRRGVAALATQISDLMREHAVPGVSVLLIKHAAVAWQRSFGVRDAESRSPVRADTIFSAGSMSKPVFAYAVMQLHESLQSLLALETQIVRHEDLVSDFSRELSRICMFLGIREVPAMGDFSRRAQQRAELTPSTAQLARGLNREGLGGWRRYRSQLAPAMPLLDPWVRRFGYDPA